ncbi:MAG: hypothetical protein QOG63_2619 [Thermoleophilaceae bacterium]|nr:hypothetical protein [Thermoleophilaceae bacterium]
MNGRAVFAVAAIAMLAPVLAGCSKAKNTAAVLKSNREVPKALPMSATGTSRDVTITVPDTVTPGLTRVDFGNNALGQHALQFIRVDKGHTPQEALPIVLAWAKKGQPLADWIHAAGGTPITEPRDKSITTQNMELGSYFVIDTALKGQPKIEATFRVLGDREDTPPNAKAQIEAYEYGFRSTGLEHGKTEVLIKNTGKQPHFVEAVRIKPGKTIDDVKAYFKARSRSGPPPLDEKTVSASAVQDGGTSQVTTLNFKKGNYALLCFVPDRKGGPPDAFKGMVAGVQIR